MVRAAKFLLIIFLPVIPVLNHGTAQPLPGDVFREYYWYNQTGDAGQTPTYNGETVHGMEVNWPGIMVLVRYENITPVSVDDRSGGGGRTPGSARVETWPNPFNSTATVGYTLCEPAEVRLHIYSLSGQVVRTLVDSYQGAGIKKVYWDGTDNRGITVGAGVCLCSLFAGDRISTRKIVFLR